jgi:hypothetical protein
MIAAVVGLAVVNAILLIRGGLRRTRARNMAPLGWAALLTGLTETAALTYAVWRLYLSGEHLF